MEIREVGNSAEFHLSRISSHARQINLEYDSMNVGQATINPAGRVYLRRFYSGGIRSTGPTEKLVELTGAAIAGNCCAPKRQGRFQ